MEVVTPAFFNEFTVKLPKPAAPVVDALAAKGVIAGVPASRLLPHDRRRRESADPGGDRNQYR